MLVCGVEDGASCHVLLHCLTVGGFWRGEGGCFQGKEESSLDAPHNNQPKQQSTINNKKQQYTAHDVVKNGTPTYFLPRTAGSCYVSIFT